MHMHVTQRKSLIPIGVIISPIQKCACQRPRKQNPGQEEYPDYQIRDIRGTSGMEGDFAGHDGYDVLTYCKLYI